MKVMASSSPLKELGHRTGARGLLRSDRRRLLRIAFRCDLGQCLNAAAYARCEAWAWGPAGSIQRCHAMATHLAWQASAQLRRGHLDAARHFSEDLEFLLEAADDARRVLGISGQTLVTSHKEGAPA